MTVKVVVRDGEPITQALVRFRHSVRQALGRPWTKRRFGYFEKPSSLRRKRDRMRRRQLQAAGTLKLHLGLAEQFRRTGPTNALGR
jgi:ribosomal protein S21